MANKKITELTADTAPTSADLVATVDDVGGTPTTKKSTIGNLFQALQKMVFGTDAGSTDTYTATLDPAPSAYVAGQAYRFKANTANTGACAIDFNSLGAKTIKKAAGGITTDLADNDIRAGQWVDLVYDGTNMQMQSTLGNAPGGGGTPGGSPTHVQYNSGGAFAGSANFTFDGVMPHAAFALGGFEEWKLLGWQENGNGGQLVNLTDGGFSIIGDGGVADVVDSDGYWKLGNTGGSTNGNAGIDFNLGDLTRVDFTPQVFAKIKTSYDAGTIANSRHWIGLFGASPMGSADPTVNAIAFRRDTGAGDSNWFAYTNDNSGGGTATDTGISVSTNTKYNFLIVVESSSSVKFYISTDGGRTYSLVATHTTNIPSGSAALGYLSEVRTLEAVVKKILNGFAFIRHH